MHIFLHLPKTAGTTFRVLLNDLYTSNGVFLAYDYASPHDVAQAYKSLSDDMRAEIAVVSSHHEFGLHRMLDGAWRYITLFREPVDRIVSAYFFMRGGNGVEAHPIFKERPELTLKDYASIGVDNGYVRHLSGKNGIVRVNDDDLEIAKKHLRDHFDAIGFSETFPESMVLFGRKLGWERVPLYRRENAMAGRPKVAEIDSETLAIIERHSALDIELYRFARELYDADIEKLGPSFRDEVARYEAMLGDVGAIVSGERQVWDEQAGKGRR